MCNRPSDARHPAAFFYGSRDVSVTHLGEMRGEVTSGDSGFPLDRLRRFETLARASEDEGQCSTVVLARRYQNDNPVTTHTNRRVMIMVGACGIWTCSSGMAPAKSRDAVAT